MNERQYQAYESDPKKLIHLIVDRDLKILHLQNQLAKLRKDKFGVKSERLSVVGGQDVLDIFLEEVPAPVIPLPTVLVPAHTSLKTKRKERGLPKDLPRVVDIVEPEQKSCPCCSETMVQIGEDVSERLEHEPAKYFIKEIHRPRYACSKCKEAGVVQAPLPASFELAEKSYAAPSLIAHVMVSKYMDHLPLYRQEQMMQRSGVSISRARMGDWIGIVCDRYLSGLWNKLKEEVLSENYIQADETTIKVQDPDVEGSCEIGYIWSAYAPNTKLSFFEYADSRSGSVAKDIFGEIEGTIQTDLYAGYNPVILPGKVTRISCIAHIRRKFIEVQKQSPTEASTVLQLIAKLYDHENKWKSLTPEDRTIQRQKHSIPILEKLKKYLTQVSDNSLPQSPIIKAINYALKQWEDVERIFSDGRFHLDNNAIEREIRPIALGRKNYLFAGSHDGARRAAILYSLFACCRLHKVNPYLWLKDVLEKIAHCSTADIPALLPHRWYPKI